MDHNHKSEIHERVEMVVYHCKCGAWKRPNGEWMPGPFGPVERLLTEILTAPPEVRALVARIVAGGAQSVELIEAALRVAASRSQDEQITARLRALAGNE